jgi:hypothetical protein
MTRLLVAAVLTITGCASERTRIALVVDSDLEVPSELAALRVIVDARQIGGDLIVREIDLVEQSMLPIALSVVHEGGALGPIGIGAEGIDPRGEVIVAQRARLSFVAQRTIELRLELERECRDRMCGGAETCVEGECVDDDVDGMELPDASVLPSTTERDASPRPLDGGIADGAPRDAPPDVAADSGERQRDDAGPPLRRDGGSSSDGGPWAGCDRDGTCAGGACECASSCCVLVCAPGARCEDVECTGSGTRCAIEAEGAAHAAIACERGARCAIDARGAPGSIDVTCKHDATCEVDCRGSASCAVRCQAGANCLLECGDDRACGIDCPGLREVDCGGGVSACGRSCP